MSGGGAFVVDAAATERVRVAFEENFSRGKEVGASVAVWQSGKQMICFDAGWRDAARSKPWDSETLVLIWSATKGLASACLLHALDARGLDLQNRVVDGWPAFGRNGKDHITFGQVVSHQAGLGALEEKNLSLLDHDGVARAIEDQKPFWHDGHGYGPRTYGFIVDEIVRQLAGSTLGDYWRKHFGEPLGLDLWIGLPESQHARVAQMLPAKGVCEESDDPLLEALSDPASLSRKAFSSPAGLLGASAMNSPAARLASIPSLGGIGSASALAKFYHFLSNGGEWEGKHYCSSRVLDWMTTRLVQGQDRILHVDTAFSAGFMMDPEAGEGIKLRRNFGPSRRAFGHPGAGGSLAFADPDSRLGFAYVMNQMESGALPKERALSLVRALYG